MGRQAEGRVNAVQNGRTRPLARRVQDTRHVTASTPMPAITAARLNPVSILLRVGALSAAALSLIVF